MSALPSPLIAVIDLETTGLSPWHHHRIVEIGVVLMTADGTILKEYETLINPNRDMGPSRIHQISASDVSKAPQFSEIAGDLIEFLSQANVLAGHNVSFDLNFLLREFERLSVSFPDTPRLCTCRLTGMTSLMSCCEARNLPYEGMQHRAISDARATSKLLTTMLALSEVSLDDYVMNVTTWPSLPPGSGVRFPREHAESNRTVQPGFLKRLTQKIRHDDDASGGNELAYLALIDRVLEDRRIDSDEENTLVESATIWGISGAQLERLHRQYLNSLTAIALSDGVVTDSELRDLHSVARLLGLDIDELDDMLSIAAGQLAAIAKKTIPNVSSESMVGQSVCFTGELLATINGKPITREIAEAIATGVGLKIASSVTKKLDLLVVADPDTQSGKAKKARDYGIRIMSDAVFWRHCGIEVG